MAVTPAPETSEAAVLTEIMLAVFRANGRLLEKGDRLVAPLKLTSARWQVLGAMRLASRPITAPQIAETMGMTRQGAQKQLNALEEAGFCERNPNPRHQRSPLYTLTVLGSRTLAKAVALEEVWAKSLLEGSSLSQKSLATTLHTLNIIGEQLNLTVPDKGGKS